MKKIYLLLSLLFALSLGACSGGKVSDTGSDTNSTANSTANSDTNSDTSSNTSSNTALEHAHTWGEATYGWNGLECTAETTCTASDCEETLTETVTASYVKDTDATCYNNESGHFEALFENEVFVDQITEANSADQEDTMLAHTLEDVTYSWDGDACTASTACTVEACGAKIAETVKANLVEDTAGDCYNNAKGHYEAVFESAYLATQKTEANGVEIPDSKKHQAEMYLDEDRRQYVTACTLCNEEFAVENLYDTYTDGETLNGGANYVLPVPISMSALSGKALRFEFKFTSDTGSFAFSLSGNDWLHITNVVTITKTEGGFTVTDSGNDMACGRIVDAGNGWYAWEINAAAFPCAEAATATSIDMIIPRNTVAGTVCIDWDSLAVVDAYTSRDVPTVYKTGDSLGQINFPLPILMSQMEDKAIRFEFKFESETGSFGFQVMGLEWNRISDIVTITKTANGISANFGRIVDAGDGWYAWELNKSGFTGDGVEDAPTIDFIYPRANVEGDLYVDWQSVSVVDEYEVDARLEGSKKYQTGETLNGGENYVLPTPISMTALDGKAVHFEFKFETETGSFAFSLLQYDPWKALTNVVTITKTESGFTVTDADGNKPCGRIVEAGDGWYAWELNAADFPAGTAAEAQVFDLIVPRNTVVGTLYLDWNSLTVVDEYDNRIERATKYENGETLNGGANYVLPTPMLMSELNGKALRFEFKFVSDTGSFAFSLMEYAPWLRLTNTVTITKTESGFTVVDDGANKTCGRIVDAGNGWCAWEINATDFPGSGAATAQMIDLIVPRNTVEGTLYFNWNSFAIVDEYDNRIERATKYENGEKLNGGANYVLPTPVPMTALNGKALRFEFKFETETGSFAFSLSGNNWLHITNIVTITKTESGFTVTDNGTNKPCGRIVDAGNGWCAWEINATNFPNAEAATATSIDIIIPRNTVVGTLYLDWKSLTIVDEYDNRIERATKYENGETLNGGANYVLPTPVPVTALNGKALRFEFKFETETGSFAFSLLQYDPWKPLTNIVTITKTESGFTVTDADGNKHCGRIVDAGNGWYAWELNAADFPAGTAAEAQVFDLVVPRNTVVGTLYLDWKSLTVVDAYTE